MTTQLLLQNVKVKTFSICWICSFDLAEVLNILLHIFKWHKDTNAFFFRSSAVLVAKARACWRLILNHFCRGQVNQYIILTEDFSIMWSWKRDHPRPSDKGRGMVKNSISFSFSLARGTVWSFFSLCGGVWLSAKKKSKRKGTRSH